ncbi:hypothetical protein VNI00_002069 [Paramarasmius palmivorus]|uniref:Copper homeostasis protein cutC homolog n=1 Tax=Paramarasmius palmivorus TaxID=297713 RepID=A0AAW0E477_9AGAR
MNVTRQPVPSILLEVCVDSVESALKFVAIEILVFDVLIQRHSAAKGGANRLELCGNLGLGGGTTPSAGLLRSVQKALTDDGYNIPIMAMIRPRVGDFLYSEHEVDIMIQDIEIFKEFGVQGVVFGALTAEGNIDIQTTRRLVEASLPLEVCFHRAFDMTKDADAAFRDIRAVGAGITRILTRYSQFLYIFLFGIQRLSSSGQAVSVVQSLPVVKMLIETSKDQQGPVIMPGSGVNARSVEEVVECLGPFGLLEIHMSGGGWLESGMSHRPEGMGMGASEAKEWCIWRTSESSVRQVREKLDRLV